MSSLGLNVSVKCDVTDEDFDAFLDRVNDLSEFLENEVVQDMNYDAGQIALALQQRYNQYIADATSEDNLGSYSDTSISEEASTTQINYRAVKNGFNISLTGPYVLYHEFGTGQRGKEKPHQSQALLSAYNWKYAIGNRIIQQGSYINRSPDIDTWYTLMPQTKSFRGKSYDNNIPQWYIGMVIRNVIDYNDMVWMTPHHKVTKGLPAGQFWYDTMSDFDEAYADFENEDVNVTGISGEYNIDYKLNKRRLTVAVREYLTGRK